VVDIHSHVLSGLDDGAKNFEESLAMVRMAALDGTTDLVATPHCDLRYAFQPEEIQRQLNQLQASVGLLPRLYSGCDFHLTADSIADAVAFPAKYTINHKNYLLIEFSDSHIPKTTPAILYRLLGAGMTPVITHPERNQWLQKSLNDIAEWVELGCYVQVTAQSFLGRFGNHARDTAHTLLKQALVHFVASDGHDTKHRPPVLHEARTVIAKAYGEPLAEALFQHNPQLTLSGGMVDSADCRPGGKKWFFFPRS
jgi:protein-tyrosine phosphatase